MRHRIQRILIGLLVATLLTCPAFAATFPDVDENTEYAEAVEYVSDAGIMVGDENGNFNPDKTVTRAEMATIICNMLGEAEGITKIGGIFTDVPESHWASGYIAKAVSLGAISGHGDGRFGPEDIVTYEQALTMLVRALNLEENALEAGGYPMGYVSVAQKYGFTNQISAKNGDLMLRWQIAVIIYNTQV